MIAMDTMAGDDAALLERMAGRDPEGVSLLYDRYGALAFSLAYRLLRERGAAEDVVQASFLAVWRSAATYDARRGAVRPWLLTIVHHQAITALRARNARGGTTLDIDTVAALAAVAALAGDGRARGGGGAGVGGIGDLAARPAADRRAGLLRWAEPQRDRRTKRPPARDSEGSDTPGAGKATLRPGAERIGRGLTGRA
jgi:RNA polymerase sigma factor (sigma-70 family)